MSTHATDKQATIVPPAQLSKGQQDNSIVTDDSGRAVLALLQKAAEMAKDDCARAIIWRISFRFSCEPLKKEQGISRLRLHIFAIEPRGRKHGCHAYIMKLRTFFFRTRTAIPAKRRGNECQFKALQ